MNELQIIHLLNVLIAFFGGSAIGMAIMMCNYGFFHRAVEVIRQKYCATRGMATRIHVADTDPKPHGQPKRARHWETVVCHLADREPVYFSGVLNEELMDYTPTTWSDVEDHAPAAVQNTLNSMIYDYLPTHYHKKYQVIYMCDTQGEVMATDLSYGDAQATVRCLADNMHEENAADLVIREITK